MCYKELSNVKECMISPLLANYAAMPEMNALSLSYYTLPGFETCDRERFDSSF